MTPHGHWPRISRPQWEGWSGLWCTPSPSCLGQSRKANNCRTYRLRDLFLSVFFICKIELTVPRAGVRNGKPVAGFRGVGRCPHSAWHVLGPSSRPAALLRIRAENRHAFCFQTCLCPHDTGLPMKPSIWTENDLSSRGNKQGGENSRVLSARCHKLLGPPKWH